MCRGRVKRRQGCVCIKYDLGCVNAMRRIDTWKGLVGF